MPLRTTLPYFAIFILAGCGTYWGRVPYTPPPPSAKNVAYVRLIGNPPGFTISQYGNKPGAVDDTSLLILRPTHDLGFNKVSGVSERYRETYYETLIYADTPTRVGFRYVYGCSDFGYTFVPQRGETYEFRLSLSDKSGYCVLYANQVVYDAQNDLYIERALSPYQGYHYAK